MRINADIFAGRLHDAAVPHRRVGGVKHMMPRKIVVFSSKPPPMPIPDGSPMRKGNRPREICKPELTRLQCNFFGCRPVHRLLRMRDVLHTHILQPLAQVQSGLKSSLIVWAPPWIASLSKRLFLPRRLCLPRRLTAHSSERFPGQKKPRGKVERKRKRSLTPLSNNEIISRHDSAR